MRAPKVPSEIERAVLTECISAEAARKYFSGALPGNLLEEFIPALQQISSSYVQASASPQIFNDTLRARAYALYYLPINFAKIQSVLISSSIRQIEPTVRVCDYGSGPGTASLAFASLHQGPCDITCYDQSEPMRRLGEKIFRGVIPEASGKVATFVSSDPLTTSNQFDYIFAANVLNEMSESSAHEKASTMYRALTPHGTLVLLEPALKEPTRRLMRLRDSLLAEHSDLAPLFPCTHAHQCPMVVKSPEDWCHGTLTWERPAIVQALDDLTGFNKHRIKFAALVLSRGAKVRGGLRIITDAVKSNRGTTATVCGEEYFGTLELLKRNRSEANRGFLKAEGYDHLSINGWDGGGSIQKSASVSLTTD